MGPAPAVALSSRCIRVLIARSRTGEDGACDVNAKSQYTECAAQPACKRSAD